jgi:hypothetical protein
LRTCACTSLLRSAAAKPGDHFPRDWRDALNRLAAKLATVFGGCSIGIQTATALAVAGAGATPLRS